MLAASQAAVVSAMSEPAFYATQESVAHEETHISHVFLVGDRAYKLKKDVKLPFVDYGTLERRHFFCREEIRLNRPLAPRVYLRVRAVVLTRRGFALADENEPKATEYVVEMQRFEETATLASHVDGHRCDAALLRSVGEHIAAFHAAAPRASNGQTDLAVRVREDIRQLGAAAADTVARSVATEAAEGFTVRVAAQLEDRRRRGLVREVHGDLRLEHVLVGVPLQLIDCVEFDAALRTSDVAYDLAFAVMELHGRGAASFADHLVSGYRAAGGDSGDDGLLAGMAACRALVRAKIAALRKSPRSGELEGFLALARRLFWVARGPVTVIVCGAAAAGKTTLAAELSRASGLPHLSSDVVRKARAGIAATTRLPESAYTPTASRAVYEELGRRAREHAANGTGAIVDATFRREADRLVFDRALGDAQGVRVVLHLSVPPSVARKRAALRARDPDRVSDAGPQRAAAQAAEFEPFDPTWRARSADLDADRPIESLAQLAEAAIDAQLL